MHQVFQGRDFTTPDASTIVSGNYILANTYDQSNVTSWGMTGAMIAYLIAFRLMQFTLFQLQTKNSYAMF